MARARAILQSEFPYSINARCINREWFNLEMKIVWDIFCDELYMTSIVHRLKVHLFVLMSNHFHLVASTPQANISQCMQFFMGNVSRRLNEKGNRIDGTFAGRHFKTILQHPNYYLNAYKYSFRNPVTAGICKNVEDYPFSTLRAVLGFEKVRIPLVEDATLFSDIEGTLKWLNQAPEPERLEAVRYALKRPYYKVKKGKVRNQPLMGGENLL